MRPYFCAHAVHEPVRQDRCLLVQHPLQYEWLCAAIIRYSELMNHPFEVQTHTGASRAARCCGCLLHAQAPIAVPCHWHLSPSCHSVHRSTPPTRWYSVPYHVTGSLLGAYV